MLWPFVRMTTRLMQRFGQPPIRENTNAANTFTVENTTRYEFPGPTCAIERDATAASYCLALPLVAGGGLAFPHFQVGLQGDAQFVEVLYRVGLQGDAADGTLHFRRDPAAALRGVTEDFSGFSDTFLTLPALAPLLEGPTRISGIAHTRKQETDRVSGMARELLKLGQDVHEENDALTITPRRDELQRRTAAAPLEIETYGDHRFAMSFGILGSHDLHGDGRPWLAIRNPACCAKTFPHFFELLESLRQNSLAG